jgi:hypoxanthine phosphoribosyltransferase
VSVKMKCRILSFEEVYGLTRQLARQVKESEYGTTTVVGLARGGWVPARLLCDLLGITDLISLKVEHWLETGKTKDEATIRYPLTGDLRGKNLLVVDDIADTGKSLMASTNYLSGFNANQMKTATMQYLPGSMFRPDFFAEEVKTWTWFIYPWNWIEDTSTLIVRLMGTHRKKTWSAREVNEGLADLFEIDWDDGTLRLMLQTMVERSQLNEDEDGYWLRDTKVIQL